MKSCKDYSSECKEKLKKQIEEKKKSLYRPPTLAVVQIGDDAASNSYIKGKIKDCKEVGMVCNRIGLDENKYDTKSVSGILKVLSEDVNYDGIILQLPIPDKFNLPILQNCISPEKDVDGFRKDSVFDPCTPKGIIGWLDDNKYDYEGKKAIVIGRSNIVGKPLVKMLIEKGSTVTCCNSKTKNLKEYTRNADLIISAIGKQKNFSSSYFYTDQVIVDVGINRDENGKLCGDIDYDDVRRWGNTYVTPVPEGVGLLTRVALLQNTFKAYKRKIEGGLNEN